MDSIAIPTVDLLTTADVYEVAQRLKQIRLTSHQPAIEKIINCNYDYKTIREREIVYGDRTGFGAKVTSIVSASQDKEKQKNLIYSLRCGYGDFLDEEQVRAAMFIRACVLSKGHSGVRIGIIEEIKDLLNRNQIPPTPSLGSIGHSGDLVPSSYYAWEILNRIGLEGREGLALVNGTQFASGISCLILEDFKYLFDYNCGLFALLVQCLEGIANPFFEKLHDLKKHVSQRTMATHFRYLFSQNKTLRNLDSITKISPEELKNLAPIQDPYSIRCLPQELGPILYCFQDARKIVENEINSISDNPVIIEGEIHHGGHFSSSYVAMAMDNLKSNGIRALAYVMRAYMRRITDEKLNGGILPTYLINEDNGLNNGLQGIAGLAYDSIYQKLLKESVSDRLFALNDHEANNQDVVGFGLNAALSATNMIEYLISLTSCLAIATRQAIEMRGFSEKLSPITRKQYERLADMVPFIKVDRPLDTDHRLLLYSLSKHAL